MKLLQDAHNLPGRTCVQVTGGLIYPMIGGAFDSEDDTFKEPRNTLYIGATLSQDIRNAVAGIVPFTCARYKPSR